MKSLIIRLLLILFGRNKLCHKFARLIIPYYDNDGNSDIAKNGEKYLLEYLILNNLLKTVFDVGANKGQYSETIISLSNDIKIYAFEPGSVIEDFKRNVHKNKNVTIIPMALSSYQGVIEFHQSLIHDYSTLNSIYDMSSIGYKQGEHLKINVPCTTIDIFCKEHGINHIDFLKIDVEGHELDVIRGGEELFSQNRIDFCQFEFGHAARAARVYLFDLVNFMHRHSYSIFIIKPKHLEPLKYTPWEENRFNMINFLAINPSCLEGLKPIIKYNS